MKFERPNFRLLSARGKRPEIGTLGKNTIFRGGNYVVVDHYPDGKRFWICTNFESDTKTHTLNCPDCPCNLNCKVFNRGNRVMLTNTESGISVD